MNTPVLELLLWRMLKIDQVNCSKQGCKYEIRRPWSSLLQRGPIQVQRWCVTLTCSHTHALKKSSGIFCLCEFSEGKQSHFISLFYRDLWKLPRFSYLRYPVTQSCSDIITNCGSALKILLKGIQDSDKVRMCTITLWRRTVRNYWEDKTQGNDLQCEIVYGELNIL